MTKMMVCGAMALTMAAMPASAGPETADLWIGLAGSDNGFLIDEASGDTWMTGVCLLALAQSEQTPDGWTSRNRTIEAVGRLNAALEQNFTFTVSGETGVIAVENPARGGVQTFPAVVVRCDRDPVCAVAAAQAPC